MSVYFSPRVRILLFLCLFCLLFLSSFVSADKKSKKEKKSSKKESKKEEAVKPKKGARNIKTLSQKELMDLEEQWMEDEEESPEDARLKSTRGPNGERRPPVPTGKTEMAFVTLKGSLSKPETEKYAARWADLLISGGVKTRSYVVENSRILFVCDENGFKDMVKVKQFVLDQAETEEFEWNQQKTKPSGKHVDTEEELDPLSKFGLNL